VLVDWLGLEFLIVASAAAAIAGCPLNVPAKNAGRPGVVLN
jgi:hypothetical protein